MRLEGAVGRNVPSWYPEPIPEATIQAMSPQNGLPTSTSGKGAGGQTPTWSASTDTPSGARSDLSSPAATLPGAASTPATTASAATSTTER